MVTTATLERDFSAAARVVDDDDTRTSSTKSEEEEEEAKRELTSSSSSSSFEQMMSPVKFEKKSAAVDALEKDDDDDAEALLPPENTNNDNKNSNKTKLLSKMRPKALDLSPNGLHKGQVGTASTDELVNLEIREKSWRECKNRASVLYENFLYVGGDELVTKEKQLRRLKEELNVKRILCCYDPNDSVSSSSYISSPGKDARNNRNNNNNIIINNNESGDAALTPSSCASGGASFASTPTTEGEGDFESALAYFERMSLPLMDTSEEDIACVLYDAFDFILGNERRECVWEKNINKRKDEVEKEEEEAGGCLVHCQMGCSRSVAICVAFIMWREGVTYDEAFERVKESRSIARPNIGFVKTLEAWHEARTNRTTTSSSSSSGIFDVVSYRIVEHKNRKGYVVPKRETFINHATTNQDSTTNNTNSSNSEKKKEKNDEDDEENGTTTPSPKASSPSFSSSSPVGYCLSPKDDPNLVALRFKNAKGKKTLFQPTIVVGDRVDRDNDPRVDEQTLDKITKQILFYEYGVTL